MAFNMAKLKDAWKVASLLLDLSRMWSKVNKANPITPARIVATLKRIYKFFTGCIILTVLAGCDAKTDVKVYTHVPEQIIFDPVREHNATTASEKSLLVPAQVLLDPVREQIVAPPEHTVIVRVDAGKTISRGSGTLYRPDAIVTCYHLFTDSKKGIEVVFNDGTIVKGKLIQYDKTYDLAVIQIAPVKYTPARLSQSKNLECVFTARGYGKPGEDFKEASGRFRGWRAPSAKGSVKSTLLIDCRVRKGDSGGGIFNDDGLYGVIWGCNEDGTHGTAGAGFRQFIKRANAKLDQKPSTSPKLADRVVVYSDPEICAACQRLEPILETLKREGYNVIELEPTAEYPRIPTLVFFSGDEVVRVHVGFVTADTIKLHLEK